MIKLKLDMIVDFGSFSDTVNARSLKFCMIITLFGGLHCQFRFDDLDVASRSQVCQKY